ncbi:hypothetical protein Clacol_004364 [Clathrus columnatus]|uniref:cystathionine gamma-lyase n=1 Tax=Clathrus columnatus TaxID=1419009 RepID=A0AAV5ABX3_9AGAM|nr:hypothetical protein Clacol_004364 [Clathrus columnatus]
MSPYVANGVSHNDFSKLGVQTPPLSTSSTASSSSSSSLSLSSSLRSKASSRHDGFSTRAIHIGSEPSQETNAVIPSISLSTTYKQDGIGNHKGFEYSRSLNPNRDAFERMIAALEDGLELDKKVLYNEATNDDSPSESSLAVTTRGYAFSSGSAATATVLQSLGPDAHILCINDVYGGTYRYLQRVANGLTNLSTTFIDFENATDDNIINSIRPNTKLIWIESPTNPTLRLANIPHISSLIHSHPHTTPSPRYTSLTRPLILVDSTFLSPFYISPLKAPINADITLHSVTKYINGHSDVVMGALIVRLSSPYPHPFLEALPEKLSFLQNAHGAIPSSFDSWLAQRGAKTLALRMKQHGLNALALARALKRNPNVKEVVYPGLRDHPANPIVWSILRGSWANEWIKSQGFKQDEEGRGDVPFGGIISIRIDISSSPSTPETFLTSLRLFTLAESLGGVESLAELPARMTHAGIPAEERAALGIDDSLVRLSVGVEETSDLIADVEQALEIACGGGGASASASANGDASSISTVEEEAMFVDVDSANGSAEDFAVSNGV